MNEWITVKSSVEPNTLDMDSSSYYIYIRRNVERKEDEADGVYYSYEEMKMPKSAVDYSIARWCESLAATRNDVLEDGSVTQGGLVDIYLNQFEIMSKLDKVMDLLEVKE